MDRIKFFKIDGPDEEEVQERIDEWIDEVNPTIKDIKINSLVSSSSYKYLFVFITYNTEQDVKLQF